MSDFLRIGSREDVLIPVQVRPTDQHGGDLFGPLTTRGREVPLPPVAMVSRCKTFMALRVFSAMKLKREKENLRLPGFQEVRELHRSAGRPTPLT